MIVCDERNPRAVEVFEGLRARLPSDWKPRDGVALVIGGDGFLLRTVQAHGTDLAFLGLNAGHVGFLLNDASDLDEVVVQLLDERFTVHAFPVVEGQLALADGSARTEWAINDIYLERMSGQTARLSLKVDGHEVVERLSADGLIFATALGSTAYAFSAGGMPIHPLLRVLEITPICPHRVRLPSVVLPAESVAEVEVLNGDWRPVRAVADGRATDHVRSVRIRIADHSVHLAYLEPHDFTRQMLRKIVLPP